MIPRGFVPVCLLLLGGASFGPGANAADPPGPRSILPASPDSALGAVIEDLPGEYLGLDVALAAAWDRASAARIAVAELAAAEQAVRREKGAFDPELFGSADWGRSETPLASLFAGADVLQSDRANFEAGARLQTRIGTELTASVNSLRSTSNSAYASLSPQYDSFAALSLRQPLLKGFGPAARSGLDSAENRRLGADARYAGALLAVRTEVETVYWQLYASERDHAVTQLIRDRAAAFLDDTQKRAQAGLVGPSAVANAEFFLTEAEQALLDTEEQLDRLSDRLASLMGRRPGAVRFRPEDTPEADFPSVIQDTLVAVALARNPDLIALDRDADAVHALARGATWDARPTLDLVGGLGGAGLSGRPRDVFFPGDPDPYRTAIDGTRSDALDQAVGREYPDWNVGLVFTLPLGGREDGGERDRLRAEVVRAEQQLIAARRRVEEDVRARHRELDRGRERLSLARRGVAASIRQVEIGMLEFQNGRTTAFEVVRLAADLATAQQRYSDALVRTARAAAELRQLTGGWYPPEDANPDEVNP